MGVFKIPKYEDDRASMIIDYLGKAISDEWLAHLQYWVGSVIVIDDEGAGSAYAKKRFIRKSVIPELRQHSNDEYNHATTLSAHFLNYAPRSDIPLSMEDILRRRGCGYIEPQSPKCANIIMDSEKGEMCAIKFYSKFLDEMGRYDSVDDVLHDDIVIILEKEDEHLGDLNSLMRELELKM